MLPIAWPFPQKCWKSVSSETLSPIKLCWNNLLIKAIVDFQVLLIFFGESVFERLQFTCGWKTFEKDTPFKSCYSYFVDLSELFSLRKTTRDFFPEEILWNAKTLSSSVLTVFCVQRNNFHCLFFFFYWWLSNIWCLFCIHGESAQTFSFFFWRFLLLIQQQIMDFCDVGSLSTSQFQNGCHTQSLNLISCVKPISNNSVVYSVRWGKGIPHIRIS